MIAEGAGGVCQYFIKGGISFNTAGSYFPFPRTWNNIK